MKQDLEAYYEKAGSWALGQQATLRTKFGLTLAFAAVLALIAVAEGFALLLLLPTRTAVPIPILVDRQTGYLEVLKPDGTKAITSNDALVQSLLAQYVLGREGFNIATVSADYRRVSLWSGDEARRDYLARMAKDNPDSPLRRYGRAGVVEARIKSISFMNRESAFVRFETRRLGSGGEDQEPQAWTAVVSFRFIETPMRLEDRLVNPLGFQVVGYQRDPETIMEARPDSPAHEEAPAPLDARPLP